MPDRLSSWTSGFGRSTKESDSSARTRFDTPKVRRGYGGRGTRTRRARFGQAPTRRFGLIDGGDAGTFGCASVLSPEVFSERTHLGGGQKFGQKFFACTDNTTG